MHEKNDYYHPVPRKVMWARYTHGVIKHNVKMQISGVILSGRKGPLSRALLRSDVYLQLGTGHVVPTAVACVSMVRGRFW